MSEETVGRNECKAIGKGYEAAIAAQDRRVERLEDAFARIAKVDAELVIIVKELQKGQERTDERLDELEQKPGKRWDVLIATMISSVVGVVIGLVVSWFKVGS